MSVQTLSPEASEEARLAATRKQVRMGRLLSLTLLALLAVMWLVLAFSTSSFWTYNNISNLLRQGSMIAILAMGETFVIITAGIDLSVGAVVGFTSVIVAWLLTHGFPIWASILITLLLGFGIGTFHGFGITKLGLPPFIMTLATLTALRGIGLLMTNGATISITNDTFTGFSRGDFLGIPNLFWMVVVVAVPAYIFLHRSRYGRYLFAIGSNTEAARLCRDFARLAYRHWQRHPGGGLGAASHCFLGDRRHQPLWRGRLGAWSTSGLLHPDDHQQRRQFAQRERVLAANYHRRSDHRHRLLRRTARQKAVIGCSSFSLA